MHRHPLNVAASSMAQPVPPALDHLIALNAEHGVLICVDNKCQCVLEPTAISRHLLDKNKMPAKVRKQVGEYIKGSPFAFNHTNVPLPQDVSAPQPIIPAVDGFQCKECPFKTQSRPTMRQHANQAHNKKRAADKDVSQAVQLQSWFWGKRERHWVVDEIQQGQQERQATAQDVGEEPDDLGQDLGSRSNNESGQDEVDDQIIQNIENWQAKA
jgi:hypothetical protein